MQLFIQDAIIKAADSYHVPLHFTDCLRPLIPSIFEELITIAELYVEVADTLKFWVCIDHARKPIGPDRLGLASHSAHNISARAS